MTAGREIVVHATGAAPAGLALGAVLGLVEAALATRLRASPPAADVLALGVVVDLVIGALAFALLGALVALARRLGDRPAARGAARGYWAIAALLYPPLVLGLWLSEQPEASASVAGWLTVALAAGAGLGALVWRASWTGARPWPAAAAAALLAVPLVVLVGRAGADQPAPVPTGAPSPVAALAPGRGPGVAHPAGPGRADLAPETVPTEPIAPAPAPGAAVPTDGVPTAAPAADSRARRPLNVVLVTIDTLRADQIAPCGGSIARTPNIDALARGGALACRAIVTQPSSNTSHASILTGAAPNSHGIRTHMVDRLRSGVPTLAELLRARGYQTAGLYSWVSFEPAFSGLDRGFETYQGYVVNLPEVLADPAGQYLAATYRRLKEYLKVVRTSELVVNAEAGLEASIDGRADVTTDAALRWLGERDDRPFFLWLHYFDPHYPYSPPPPHDVAYDPEYAGSVDGRIQTIWKIGSGELVPERRDVEHLIALYRGEIAFTDEQLGRLLRELDARGLTDRTVVVLLGDHGESFGEHGQWLHRSLHHTTIEVPLIVRLPGQLPPVTIRGPVSALDVAPTILDLLDMPIPPTVEGRSLRPLAAGRAEPPDRIVFSQSHDDSELAAVGRDWTLIAEMGAGVHGLYHHPTDPTQRVNRIDEAARAGTPAAAAWAELSRAVEAWMERHSIRTRRPLRLAS